MKALSCRNLALLFALLVAVALSPDSGYAANFNCNNVDCLVAAINTSNTNSENNLIRLEAGAYTLTAPITITGDVTIEGPDKDKAVISGWNLTVSETGSLSLDQLTFIGDGPSFKSLLNNGVTNVIRSTFTEIRQASPPFLSNYGGTLNVKSTLFLNNFHDDPMFVVAGGTVRIEDTRFNGNAGIHFVGALAVAGGFVSISHSTFEHGQADGAGAILLGYAAIFNPPPATVVISDSAFTENVGTNAPIVNNRGTMIVTNTTIARNRGIFIIPQQGLNTGIANNSGTLLLINSTITENKKACCPTSSPDGNALFSTATAITRVQNTIVALNGTSGANEDCAGPIQSLGNNLIGNPNTCPIRPSDLTGDPGLGPFNNKDGTPGHAHYPLLPSSRAISAGNEAACPPEDQIGRSREGHCDIGSITFPGRPPKK